MTNAQIIKGEALTMAEKLHGYRGNLPLHEQRAQSTFGRGRRRAYG
jgi:hypothetical protein